jgi:hypothetical protein
VVVGYDEQGGLAVSEDSVLRSKRTSPAGEACRLWTFPPGQPLLTDDGEHQVRGLAMWCYVVVPPDSQREVLAENDRAGILHEGNTVDLVAVISGEVWLELDGVADWIRLTAGESLVQRGSKHAWHNLTDIPAYLSCVLFSAERSSKTPSRLTAEDVMFQSHDL